MKTWIVTTLIIGSICFYCVSIVNKEIQKRLNTNNYNIPVYDNNNQLTTLLDYLNDELGK
jgi:hypothetical protein